MTLNNWFRNLSDIVETKAAFVAFDKFSKRTL